MRSALIAMLFALGACGVSSSSGQQAGQSDTRQVPSNYEPGIHINGYANVGVVKSF